MTTLFKLRLENKDLMDFKVLGKHNLFPKQEPSAPQTDTQSPRDPSLPTHGDIKSSSQLDSTKPSPPLICQYRYIDRSVLEMLSSSAAHFQSTSLIFHIHPDSLQRLTYFITNLAAEAQDYRFLHEDINTGCTYLLQFDVNTQDNTQNGMIQKIEQLRLLRLGIIEDERVGLELGKRKVDGLQRKMGEITDLCDKELASIEEGRRYIKNLKVQEDALVREISEVNGRINLAKAALAEYLKVEEALREKTSERDKLVKVWNTLSKEAPTKKREMNDNLSNKFLALRADMTSEYNQKLLAHIEEERKLRITHNAAKQKEATHSSIHKMEEVQRLKNMLELRTKHRLSVQNLLQEDSSYIEIGKCKLCKSALANVVNFPCHHFGEICHSCNQKANFDSRCIRCWGRVEYYEVIAYN